MQKRFSKWFFSGLSGLALPIPKYLFPSPFQNSSRLTYYASLFNSIEINSSFYKIPQPGTVAKWAASVPDDFRFTFKLWKVITHAKDLNFKDEDVAQFMNSINTAQDKKACLLIQLPPSLGADHLIQLDKLLHAIHSTNAIGWKIAIEFRNKSWYNLTTYKLLNLYKVTLVIHDLPKSATPLVFHKSAFMYIRFHGPTGNYRDGYSDDFLREYATYVREWIEEGKEVYMYFNNTVGDAFTNLKTINGLLHHETGVRNSKHKN